MPRNRRKPKRRRTVQPRSRKRRYSKLGELLTSPKILEAILEREKPRQARSIQRRDPREVETTHRKARQKQNRRRQRMSIGVNQQVAKVYAKYGLTHPLHSVGKSHIGDSKMLNECNRRMRTRSSLFAKGKIGKGRSIHTSKRYKETSKIKC